VGTINNDVLGLVLDHAVHTDQVSIQQIYDVRRTIEMRTVSLAALRRLDVEADTIVAHAAGMRDTFARPAEVMEHDIAFPRSDRRRLPQSPLRSGRRLLRSDHAPDLADRLGEPFEPTLSAWAVSNAMSASAAAIEVRDARARLRRAMAQHFDDSVKALLAAGVI